MILLKQWRVALILSVSCHCRRACFRLLGPLRMPPLMLGPVLSGRLFAGCTLIRSGCFVGLGESSALVGLIRGCDLYRGAGLQLILTVNDNLFPLLHPAVDQRLTTINLGSLHRAHF